MTTPRAHTTYNHAIADTVVKGLSATPKRLPGWLFYDDKGDELFRQIMRIPQYYPTRCEYDILQKHKDALLKAFRKRHAEPFRLIELGAGDGMKTEILLRHFEAQKAAFTYVPIDISPHVLQALSERLTVALPTLRVEPMNKTYEDALAELRNVSEKKLILFLGANIGNFNTADAVAFLKRLALPLSSEDMILIGFDLKKDPRIILEAYDDPQGVTAKFNLNVLDRLNRDLGGNFDLDSFRHFPFYNPEAATIRSFLISVKSQDVRFQALDRTFHFDAWESLNTEISQKYDLPMIEQMMALSGLELVDLFYDEDKYFCDVLVRPR